MLPLKDTIRSRSFPLVTWIIIIINLVVFLIEINLSESELTRVISTYGLIPARLDWSDPTSFYPLFTSMFLHGGWFHFLSNMWIFFIFADNVEDKIGSMRFILFYLLSGLAAALLQIFVQPDSSIPSVGASGAIAGVLGSYLLFFPRARVMTFIPIFILPWLIEVPAVLFLGFWFLSQVFSGLASLVTVNGQEVGGIAWWAHIGGFLFGLLMAKPFSFQRQLPRTYPDEYWPW